MKKLLLLPIFLITFLVSSSLQQGFAQTVIDFENPPAIGAVKSISYEGFTFAATIANPAFNIGFLNGVGVGGSFALIDGNTAPNGLTRWTITRDGGLEFQFQKIWILNRDPGASSSGTIQGFKNGNPVGSAKSILFNGETVISADPDFFDVDEIRIEAPDIYVAIDNFTYGPVFVPVDSDPAEVTSISLSGAPLSNVPSVTFTVNFSKTALNVSADDFQLTSTGTAAGTITSVAGSGTSYTVTVNGITGEGSLRLDLKSGTNITNENGDPGTPAFTSGQVHFVSPCLVETFEDETIGSKTFATGTNSFTITGNLEVYRGPTLNIGIGGSRNVLKNTDTGLYTITSGSGTVLMNSVAFFLSSDSNGANPTGTGTLTLVGKRGGNTVYTITKNSGFNTSFSTNSGYTIVNFGTEGGVNNATKPIDRLEINIGGGFVYLNVDNFQFCTDTEAPSGYTATIDQDLINTANQNSVSFTLAGAEVGSSYNYTFSSSGGGTNVTGSGTVVSSTQQVSGINLTGLPDGTITLSVTLTDPSSNTGTAATDTSIKLLNNVPIALPPTNTSAFEDAFLDLNGMAVSDPDGDNQLVSFTITGGILTIGTQNISFGGNGNGSSSFTASGTLGDINTALAQARFRPTSNLFGIDAATIRFTSNDGFSSSEEASATFDIEAVNDPPLLIIPGFQVTDEDTPLVFSSANSNQIQIEDIDAGTGPMNLEISATNGTFTLATIQNISFTPGRGDGTDDPRMDFSGTLAAINSAISTLTFTPAANFSGEATLELIISDLGSTGLGGTLTDMETIRIVVTAQNDAPTDILLDNSTVSENEPVGTTVGIFSATDPDTGDTFTYTLVPGTGADDNASFSISGNELRTSQDFDFSVKNSYSIRIRVTDSGNLIFEKVFVITVEEFNDAPTDLLLSNNSVAENSPIGTAVGTFTAVDSNSGETFTYTLVTGVGDDDNGSFSISGNVLRSAAIFDFETKNSYSIRVRVTDTGGLFIELPFSITITDVNDAPTVANPIPNQNISQNDSFSFLVPDNTFEDADNDFLTYSAQLAGGGALPVWLSFDADTRTFSGTPLNSNVGTVSIDVIANDGKGGTVTDTFDITVANVNDAPTVANPIPDQNATEDVAFNFQFALNTFNDIDVGDELTYTAELSGGVPLPAWLAFDPLSRTFSGTPSNSDVGELNIVVTATDLSDASVFDSFILTVLNVNDPPTVANPIENQNATQGVFFNFVVQIDTFEDIDGDELTYTAQLAGGGPLPAWLMFDPAERTFSGTPTNSDVGTVSILVTADDENGGTVTDTFDLTVINTNDAPTVVNPIADQSATEDIAFNFQFGLNVFNDIDVGDILTYTAQLSDGGSLPLWLSFDGNNRRFSGTPGNSDVGNLDIEVTANDGNGGSASDTFRITVFGVNDAPVITAPINLQVFEDVPQALTGISFSDVDAGSNAVTATFSVASGTLSATSGGDVTVGGISNSLTLSGTINDINAFIAANNLTFTTSLNSTANEVLSININDNGNTGTGGDQIDQATVTIEVTAVNDAPVNSVPGPQQTDQDVALVFSSGNSNLISVSDVDAGSNLIQITLTASNGRITLGSTTGLSFDTGDGVVDAIIKFEGSLSDVNFALNGLTFTPTSGYNGSASLTIISNDQGFSGSGPESGLTDTDIIAITVNSINPVVSSVTSSTANGLYKEGDEISIQVIFDQPVEVNTDGGVPSLTLETGSFDRAASYVDGSGTSTLNFSYTVQAGDFSTDLDYTGINALILNGAVIENSTNDPAVLDLPVAGTANSLSGQKDISIDGVVPVITSVSVPSNGIYAIGQNLDFTINLSEAVLVNGIPQLSLTIGVSTAQASYFSGSGSNVLVFRYTVQSGDLDLNGITVGTLSLNTGTIQDAAENNANLTFNSIGSTSQVLVDGVRPFVESLSLSDNSLAIGQTATLTVAFSERISGLEIADFMVENGALSGLTSADGGETWTATFTPTSNVEDDSNVISLNNTGYADLAGNAGIGNTESFNYKVDTRRPSATIVVAEAELNSGKTSPVTITFTEAVTGLMLDDFSVANGILSDLESVDGGITWTATLTPDSGVEDASNLIILDNTGYQDLAGNTGSGITESNNYSVDTQIPAGYSVSIVPDRINGVNQNNFSFNLIGGELGSDYSFSISSNAGGTPVTGTGAVTSQNQLIDGVNVSSLPDGILTLIVTLTDASGNEGGEVSETVEKRLPAVLTITVRTQAGENNSTDGEFEMVTDNLFATNTTVTFQVGGTASSGSDYQALGSSFDFPANTPSLILPVSIIDDFNVEGEETIILTLTGTDNDLVTIGTPSEATMTISDDDVATELIITPTAGQNKEYGDADPDAYTYSVEGFKNGDNISILTGALSREVGEDVGTYSYSLGDLDAGPNYELVLNPEVFTITPATLSIQVDELEKVYGNDNPVYTYTPTGFKLNDTASILGGALGRTGGENVGTYGYNLGTLTAGANYNLQLISTTPFLITPAPLRIIADDKQKIYGEANPPLTFTYDGLVNGDTQLAVEPTLSTEATISSPVGTYDITVTGGSDPNYSILRVEGTLTIGQKTVTITASNQSKVYGEANPVLTFSYNGLLEGDTQIQNEPIISTEATISSPAGSYPITLTGGSDPNYEVILVNGTLTVGQKAVTITADDKQKIYGEANPPLTFTYIGLVNGDTQVTTEPSISTTATQSSNVGAYPITLSGGSDPNYAITLVDGTLTIGQKALTITADDKQKIYGEANPPLTFTYSGLVNGDTQVSTEPSISTTATASSNVGSYPITLAGGSDLNYAITLVDGTLTIGQKAVTITADDKQKTYGEANPALTFTYTGLVNGDTQVTTEPSISTTATQSSNVGAYPITLSGGSDPNYAITLVNGTLTIGQKAVTITADDKSKVYGEANPALTFTYTGLVNGDTKVTTEPSISTTATASSNVGTYPITLSGGSDPNYAITLVNGTLTVGQKALTITADDKQKIYGEANPPLTFTYIGLVNGDTQVTTEPSISTTATQSSNVGAYPITLSGGSDPNYAITLVNGTLTIGQKALTITADDKQKIYGAANPPLTFRYAGLVNGDTQVEILPSIATTATASSNVGTYPITLTGGADPNYAITLVDGTLTIGQKAVTITADDKQKIYGEANPPLTFSYNGLVNGDTQVTTEPSISTTATQSSNVGAYPITLSGGSDPNYAITLVNGTLTIGQKALTITADDKQKIYGEANPPLTFSYNGLVNGDTQVSTEPSIATTATASSNVGTYPITLSGGADPNYAITLVNGTLTVGQKAVTITADDKQKIYGEANPPLTFSYNGLVNGDTQVTTEPSISTTATQSSNVGAYPITLSGGSDPNYAITLVNGTLTIGQKAVTITADDKQKIYGEANPPLTFSYNGLVNGDTQVTTEPSIATTATASSNVGTYPITLSGGADPNYAITLVNGTLTVGQKALTITADDKQKIYGEANPALTFTYSGLVNGDERVAAEPSISTTALQSSNVGNYPITLSGGSDQNYAITLVNGTLTVGQKAVTITADDKQKIYGEANPTLAFSYTGLVNGDTKVTTEPSISTTATQASNVGTYPITLSGGSDPNYAITLVNGTLTIGQKALTITADDKSKVYGEANPALTFTYTGLVNGDTQVSTEPSIATTATASSNVGTYPITLSGGSDLNYAITLINGTLTVGQKALTITADSKQKIYGEANPPLTFSYKGLVNGDTQVTIEPSISTTATQGSNVGTYPIALSGGSDPNYVITLANGTLTVNQAILVITADAKSKIFGNPDPELTFKASGFKNSDSENMLTGTLARSPGENVGSYEISLGTLNAGGNYQIEFIGNELEIIPARLAEILTGGDITTPWSINPILPNQVNILTQDGQIISYNVTWDISTIDVLKRGTYTVFGTVDLPSGILNSSEQKAVIRVVVLPKPAPSDITLSNDSFTPDPSISLQEIGVFNVIDAFDDVHTIELVPAASDNNYFEIDSDVLYWSSEDEAAGVITFTILVRVTDRDGNVFEKSFLITRNRKAIDEIEVFNSFSPNEDGINDTWGIPDLQYFRGGRVQVYDKDGRRVFYTESPSIRWDGNFEGNALPTGTYIWVLESLETGEVRSGTLTLFRK